MSPDPTSRKRWLVRALKVTIVALVIWGITSTIQTALADLGRHEWTLRPIWLIVAGLLYLLSILPCGLFWHRVMLALGQRPGLWDSIRAYYIGHLGKYVPGKALVVVLRVWLVRGAGVDANVATVSVFLETLTMMAVGAFWAATILLVAFPEHGWLTLLAVLLMVAAGLPTLPPLFHRLVRRLLPVISKHSQVWEENHISYLLMTRGWLGISLGWSLMGLSLWATLRALGTVGLDPIGQLPLFTASVALAVVAGFLSGLPGGILVREGILGLLLAQQFTEVIALVSAILLRLVWIISELILSGLLYFGVRRRGTSAQH